VKWPSRLKWKYLLLGGFWAGMFIGTHLPKVPGGLENISDKTLHATAFAGLSVLLTWATYRKNLAARRHWGLVLAIIAVYGAIDELLQIPVGRHCDFNDWLADMVGAIAGLTFFYAGLICRSFFQRHLANKPVKYLIKRKRRRR
jgi:VanZ family protein